MPQMPTGQPIAKGRTAEIYMLENEQALKLYFDWVQPNWVEEEAAITRAVYNAGLPVPWCGETLQINGRYGIVFEYIRGKTMLQVFDQQPGKLFSLIAEMARLHAKLHAVSLPELPSQHQAVKHSLMHAPYIDEDQRKKLLAQLNRLPSGEQVCHSDFHPDNVMITEQGPIIIDWMAGKQGNPVADVARTYLLINNGAPIGHIPRRRMLAAARRMGYWWYQQTYARQTKLDRKQLKRWLPIMAAARLNEKIPGEQEWLLRLVEQGLKE
jgi:uncharacterized protein (TIGR02172 family)